MQYLSHLSIHQFLSHILYQISNGQQVILIPSSEHSKNKLNSLLKTNLIDTLVLDTQKNSSDQVKQLLHAASKKGLPISWIDKHRNHWIQKIKSQYHNLSTHILLNHSTIPHSHITKSELEEVICYLSHYSDRVIHSDTPSLQTWIQYQSIIRSVAQLKQSIPTDTTRSINWSVVYQMSIDDIDRHIKQASYLLSNLNTHDESIEQLYIIFKKKEILNSNLNPSLKKLLKGSQNAIIQWSKSSSKADQLRTLWQQAAAQILDWKIIPNEGSWAEININKVKLKTKELNQLYGHYLKVTYTSKAQWTKLLRHTKNYYKHKRSYLKLIQQIEKKYQISWNELHHIMSHSTTSTLDQYLLDHIDRLYHLLRSLDVSNVHLSKDKLLQRLNLWIMHQPKMHQIIDLLKGIDQSQHSAMAQWLWTHDVTQYASGLWSACIAQWTYLKGSTWSAMKDMAMWLPRIAEYEDHLKPYDYLKVLHSYLDKYHNASNPISKREFIHPIIIWDGSQSANLSRSNAIEFDIEPNDQVKITNGTVALTPTIGMLYPYENRESIIYSIQNHKSYLYDYINQWVNAGIINAPILSRDLVWQMIYSQNKRSDSSSDSQYPIIAITEEHVYYAIDSGVPTQVLDYMYTGKTCIGLSMSLWCHTHINQYSITKQSTYP